MLARDGWNVYRLLVMVRDREPERTAPAGAGGEVERARGAAALAAFRREQPFGWQEEAVQQLAAMDDRYGRAVRARDFASPPEEPAAACRLYTPRAWPRSTRSARSSAAAAAAMPRPPCWRRSTRRAPRARDPIFLLTDAADWPQQLYARLGFSPIGQLYEFLKLPLGGRG